MPFSNNKRIDDFRARIGFDRLAPVAKRVLALAWPETVTLPSLSGQAWKQTSVRFSSRSTFADSQKTWELHFGADPTNCRMLKIQVFAYSSPKRAREGFLRLASSTTMSVIPYDRSKHLLGELAIEGHFPEQPSVIWIRQNVVVDIQEHTVNSSAPPAPVFELAAQLDALMSKHEVDADSAPIPKPEVTVSTDQVKVGEKIIIRLKSELPASPQPGLALEVMERGSGFASTEAERKAYQQLGPLVSAAQEDSRTYAVKAFGPGTTAVDVVVIDPTTLLCSRKRFPIVITPK